MGCESCSNGSANPAGCNNNGWCQNGSCGNILDVYDWLSNVYYVDEVVRHELVEVRFKGTRKAFFRNVHNLQLENGQAVVVESTMGGFDVGHISLVGPLVKVQMKKYNVREDSQDIKKIYRVASQADIEKWEDAKEREYTTMMKARTFAIELGLAMKISDVEYQGDCTKATFYYTADGRVDFRELIKVFARSFKVKVEMRQIGLRQEAGRLGGIGSCGRELCCSTWLTDFNSVPTTAARYQNLFLNPLKLSGQCGRLKCCLNYELDTYLEALEGFPNQDMILKTAKGDARCVKTDILKGVMFFVYREDPTGKFYSLDIEDVKQLEAQMKKGEIIEEIESFAIEEEKDEKEIEFMDTVGEDDVNRFERQERKKKKKRPNKKNRTNKVNAENGSNRLPNAEKSTESTNSNVEKPNRENNKRPQNRQRTKDDRGNDKSARPNRTANERPIRDNNSNTNRPRRNPNDKPAKEQAKANGDGDLTKNNNSNQRPIKQQARGQRKPRPKTDDANKATPERNIKPKNTAENSNADKPQKRRKPRPNNRNNRNRNNGTGNNTPKEDKPKP